MTDKTVDFDLDGEMVPVKRAKVFGLIYHVAEQEPPEPLVLDHRRRRIALGGAVPVDGRTTCSGPPSPAAA